MASGAGELKRTLGLADAVVIGAGSMIGAGVFERGGLPRRPPERAC